jgi:hypothetical protein
MGGGGSAVFVGGANRMISNRIIGKALVQIIHRAKEIADSVPLLACPPGVPAFLSRSDYSRWLPSHEGKEMKNLFDKILSNKFSRKGAKAQKLRKPGILFYF